jgi:hypothetical protein
MTVRITLWNRYVDFGRALGYGRYYISRRFTLFAIEVERS